MGGGWSIREAMPAVEMSFSMTRVAASVLAHCAVIVAREDGNLKAVSHGGDAGPFYVDFDYRPVREVRRYI
jgi:hypothetical protein